MFKSIASHRGNGKHSPFPGAIRAYERLQAKYDGLSDLIPGKRQTVVQNGRLFAVMQREDGRPIACALSQALEWRYDFDAGFEAGLSMRLDADPHKDNNGAGTEREAFEIVLNVLATTEKHLSGSEAAKPPVD